MEQLEAVTDACDGLQAHPPSRAAPPAHVLPVPARQWFDLRPPEAERARSSLPDWSDAAQLDNVIEARAGAGSVLPAAARAAAPATARSGVRGRVSMRGLSAPRGRGGAREAAARIDRPHGAAQPSAALGRSAAARPSHAPRPVRRPQPATEGQDDDDVLALAALLKEQHRPARPPVRRRAAASQGAERAGRYDGADDDYGHGGDTVRFDASGAGEEHEVSDGGPRADDDRALHGDWEWAESDEGAGDYNGVSAEEGDGASFATEDDYGRAPAPRQYGAPRWVSHGRSRDGASPSASSGED